MTSVLSGASARHQLALLIVARVHNTGLDKGGSADALRSELVFVDQSAEQTPAPAPAS
jgi:hypothetical protein